MKQVLIIISILAVFVLSSCTADNAVEENNPPELFRAESCCKYENTEYIFRVYREKANEMRLVFLSPQQICVNFTPSGASISTIDECDTVKEFDFTIEMTTSEVQMAVRSESISDVKDDCFTDFPDNSILEIFNTAVNACFNRSNTLSRSEGDYHVYTSISKIGGVVLYIEKKSGIPEKMSVPSLDFTVEFTDFEQVKIDK